MQISKHYSLKFDKKKRSSKSITYIIIHYTGMQSERESLKRLISSRFPVSCHYLINRKGKIYQMVSEQNIAWHAGKSMWKKLKNLNKNSIGVELVNKGHKLGYQKFTKKQINSLINLCKKLKKKYKIKNNNILGHSDIAPLRKIDPGEKFPWSYLKTKGLVIYPKKTFIPDRFKKNGEKKRFANNLYKIGYRYLGKKNINRVTKNFQRKYRQENISGILDEETLKISDFLAKKSNIS